MSRQLTTDDIMSAEDIYFYNREIIYVVLKNDENVYGISKGSTEWYVKDNFYEYLESSLMMSYFSDITKEAAVEMINDWEPTKTITKKDMKNASYCLYASPSRVLNISIVNTCLTFSGYDSGQLCEEIFGRDEYEFHYSLDEENTFFLIEYFRKKYGMKEEFATILEKEFGFDDGSIRFKKICDTKGILYKFFSI